MTKEQLLKNLQPPEGMVDVVLDTDAYNEIDDQFAIAYLLKSSDKLNTVRIYAAPFHNQKSSGPEDGMLKSYDEILKVLRLAEQSRLSDKVLYGSRSFMSDEKTPVISPAAQDLAALAMSYTAEKPLYVVAIGAITNIASALLLEPRIAERIVVVWLGGHARHYRDTAEFNMVHDIAAARVVMSSAAPFVQLPCNGVVSLFTTSGPELRYWLGGKTPLSDYLCENTVKEAESYAAGTAWTRVIWDVTAVAWLVGGDRFMTTETVNTVLPDYNGKYETQFIEKPMAYVSNIKRDRLMTDLFEKTAK